LKPPTAKNGCATEETERKEKERFIEQKPLDGNAYLDRAGRRVRRGERGRKNVGLLRSE
jgi:hypothetical protein